MTGDGHFTHGLHETSGRADHERRAHDERMERTADRDGIMEPDSVEVHRYRNPWEIDAVRTFGRAPEAVAQEWKSRAMSAC